MSVKKRILFIIAGYFFVLCCHASEILHITSDKQQYNLVNFAEYYVDKTNSLTIKNIAASELPFTPVDKTTLNFGHEKNPIWIRSKIMNDTQHDKELYFLIDYARLNSVDFYWRVEGDWITHPTVGLNYPYENREVKYRTYVFKLTVPVGKRAEIYVRVQSTHAVFIPLAVSTPQGFSEHIIVDRSILGAYFGLMLGLIVYNSFLFLNIRNRSYFYYAMFMCCVFYFQFSYHGLHTSFFPHSYWWNDHSIIASIFFTIAAGSLFTRDFLHLKEYSLALNALFVIVIGANIILGAVSLIFGAVQLATAASISGLVFCIIAILAGILLWVSGFQPAKYYLLSWSLLVAGAVILILRSLNVIPTIAFSQWAFLAGSAGEAVLLSFALAYRINLLQKEKEESEKAVIRAQAESFAKSEFLSKMSHEIRTPLNGMLGMIYMLKDSRLDKDQAHYLEIAHSSGRALLNVINDVLDYSKIAAGKMELERVPFYLEKLVNESVSLFSIYAHEKKVELYLSIEPAVPRFVEGDPTRLRQVIVNLVSNAMKFTDKGEIQVRLSCPDAQNPYLIRFTVNDTGIGISTEGLQKLFKSFSQADNTTTRRYGGTGLGLAISREFVQLMGGDIEVSSEAGKGATFWFELQFAKGESDEVVAEFQKPGMRFLLIANNVGYCQAMFEQFASWNAELKYVNTGEAALQLIEKMHKEKHIFDVIVLDMSIQNEEYVGVAKKIRTLIGDAPTKIMLLTAYLQPLDQEALNEINVDQVLVKPTGPYELKLGLISALGGNGDSASNIKSVSKLPQFPGLKVLVAEDNVVNQMVIKAILQKFAIEPDLVENGKQAVDLFLRHLRNPYQMVLMDIEMPEMDGFTATKRIREIEQIYHMPETVIYALSAHALKEHEKESLQAGMNGHLKKPINIEKLEKSLTQWFN